VICNALEMMWKETAIVYFNVLPQHSPAETKIQEMSRQEYRSPVRVLKPELLNRNREDKLLDTDYPLIMIGISIKI
jgi:hypothetical protein